MIIKVFVFLARNYQSLKPVFFPEGSLHTLANKIILLKENIWFALIKKSRLPSI
jgi:hypothetical protein